MNIKQLKTSKMLHFCGWRARHRNLFVNGIFCYIATGEDVHNQRNRYVFRWACYEQISKKMGTVHVYNAIVELDY